MALRVRCDNRICIFHSARVLGRLKSTLTAAFSRRDLRALADLIDRLSLLPSDNVLRTRCHDEKEGRRRIT